MFKRFYPYEYAKSVFLIDYQKLYDLGFKGLIFDIDNTLVHHGEDSTPQVDRLFESIHQIGFKTLLLSNNGVDRIERFIKNIDTVYISNADKPNKDGYIKALEKLGLDKDSVVVIGDQIFTDIWGANKCTIPNILVRYLRKSENEKIGKKRAIEKVVLKLYFKNKRFHHRLGDILKKEECDQCQRKNCFAK